MKRMMSEKEYYKSKEHFETEESYSDYKKGYNLQKYGTLRKPKTHTPSMFGSSLSSSFGGSSFGGFGSGGKMESAFSGFGSSGKKKKRNMFDF